jgi:protein involved in polysaccharide export with SLBB domain
MLSGRLVTVHLPRCMAMAMLLASSGCLFTCRKAQLPPPPADRPINPAEHYTLACPDVIEVKLAARPQLGYLVKVNPDGCIDLGRLGSCRIEGDTVDEAAARIAEHARIPPSQVLVQVVEYKSRQVFLIGPVNGEPRVVDYRGPETVVEILQRTGGLSQDAQPDEVYVVRAHLGEGIPAEVLTVDLDAIQQKEDQRTNVHILPLDSIYVGEKPRSRIARAVPAFFKPLYASVLELIPTRKSSAKDESNPGK